MAAGSRGLISLWARICSVVACGCAVAAGTACCGKPAPPPELVSTIIFPTTLRVGEVMRCHAKIDDGIPPPVYQVKLLVKRGSFFPKYQEFALYDDGTHGDPVAGDDYWTLDLPWQKEYGEKGRITAQVELDLTHHYSRDWKDQRSEEVNLTILPPATDEAPGAK